MDKKYKNEESLKALREAENTTVMDNKAQKAAAWASQNVAESVQALENSVMDSVSKLIISNENLSESSSKSARALNRLTFALVVVGALSIVINLIINKS